MHPQVEIEYSKLSLEESEEVGKQAAGCRKIALRELDMPLHLRVVVHQRIQLLGLGSPHEALGIRAESGEQGLDIIQIPHLLGLRVRCIARVQIYKIRVPGDAPVPHIGHVSPRNVSHSAGLEARLACPVCQSQRVAIKHAPVDKKL